MQLAKFSEGWITLIPVRNRVPMFSSHIVFTKWRSVQCSGLDSQKGFVWMHHLQIPLTLHSMDSSTGIQLCT